MAIGFDAISYIQIGDPETLNYSPYNFQTNGHGDRVNSLKLINETHLASGSKDGTIKIWDLQGVLLRTISTGSAVNVIEILNNGLIAVGMDNTHIGIWSINNGSLITTLISHIQKVFSLKLLINGDLATGSEDDSIKVWDLATYTVKFSLSCGRNVDYLLQLSNTNLASALGGGGRDIYIWDLNNKTKKVILTGHTAILNALEVLTNGDLVSASDDHSIKVWDGCTYAFKYSLSSHTNQVKALKLISNELLASGSTDHTIKIWNITSREKIKEFSFNAAVYAIELLSNNLY